MPFLGGRAPDPQISLSSTPFLEPLAPAKKTSAGSRRALTCEWVNWSTEAERDACVDTVVIGAERVGTVLVSRSLKVDLACGENGRYIDSRE